MASLPALCFSARSITWPSPEKSYTGGAKSRKGLRHSPGVLMDVMRTPTSLKPAGFSWMLGDQIAAFSGGHVPRHHYYSSSYKDRPMNNFIVTRIEHKRRKPYTMLKQEMPQRPLTPTLNFAPANAIPWHKSVHRNYETTPRPSSGWRYVPLAMEPEPTTSTASSEAQESEVVYRYAPTGTEAPASFTTPGSPRKARHHVRLFSNAHQYKRDMEVSSTAATPLKTVQLPPDLQNADIVVDTNNIDDEHKRSPWFKQLLGQVIAAAELTNH